LTRSSGCRASGDSDLHMIANAARVTDRVMVFVDYENVVKSARSRFHQVGLVRFALEGGYDVGIVLSRDADLVPALEVVADLRFAEVEVAGWKNMSRVRFPGSAEPRCHFLDGEDYDAVRDITDYLKGRRA
jgi:hypothetical protein